MVALNESTSELRPCRIARSCRVTAEYPQGGTGIPAGEMNYPGAAAHMRPAAATGFRGGDATSGFGLSPNALNINEANTYHFVGSDPVGSVDPWGFVGSAVPFSYSAAQAEANSANPGFDVVSGVLHNSGPVVAQVSPGITENGIIFQTYTIRIYGIKTDTYRVRLLDPHTGCMETVTMKQTTAVLQTIVTNNSQFVDWFGGAIGVVGGIAGGVGLFLPPPFDLMVGGIGSAVAVAGSGLVLLNQMEQGLTSNTIQSGGQPVDVETSGN